MKSPKIKLLLMTATWCATAGAAFWYGRHSATPDSKANMVAVKGKALTDRAPAIIINPAQAKAAPTTNDLLHSKTKPTPEDLKAWADSLDPAQCAAMLDDLQKLPGGDPRDAMLDAMIASWAARDPETYLTGYAKITNPRSRETGVGDALKAMATKDPKAAVAWLTDSKEALPNGMLAQRYRLAIQGIAANDPQVALEYVKGLDTGSTANAQIQRQGLNAVADALAADGKFTDAAKMFAGLTDETQRDIATNELMVKWAQSNPADATAYLNGMTDPAQRGQLASQVVATWARNDPQAAAAWAAKFDASGTDATGQPAGAALAYAMRSWSRYDLDGPAQFLNTLTPSAGTDPAVVTFTMQARNVDPSTAMVWANQITDNATRDKTTGAIALSLLANGNVTAVNQMIANHTITPEQAQWLQGLPTDNPQALTRMSRRLGTNFATNPGRAAPWNPNPPAPGAAPAGGTAPRGGIFQQGRGGFGGGRGGAGG